MASIKYTKLNRRGHEIVLPTEVYNGLRENGMNVSLVLHPNSKTVQLTRNNKYLGTLKEYMGVGGFKNGNSCDFHISNLIDKD